MFNNNAVFIILFVFIFCPVIHLMLIFFPVILIVPPNNLFLSSLGDRHHCTSFWKERRRHGEKSSLEERLCLNGVLKEENRVPTSPGAQHSVFKGQLWEKPGRSLFKTSTSLRFNQRPLIYLTSLLLRRAGACVLSLSLSRSSLFPIYHWFYQCRGVSEPCHQSSALCVALTDPLHLTAPVWLLLAQRWRLIDVCPNRNYSASLSLAWCGHKRAAGWQRHKLLGEQQPDSRH